MSLSQPAVPHRLAIDSRPVIGVPTSQIRPCMSEEAGAQRRAGRDSPVGRICPLS